MKYCVLYVRDTGLDKVAKLVNSHIPEGRGVAFSPKMEYYRRSNKKIQIKSVYPGYLFIYSDLNVSEIHQLIRNIAPEITEYIREIGMKEKIMMDEEYFYGEDGDIFDLTDISQEEAEFLDFLRSGNGLLEMSSGYEEGGRCVIMEGPLKAFESRIKSVDKHNRKAFLDFEINGKAPRAGLEIKPKAHWFPQEDSAITKLSDGTEVDLTELIKNVTVFKG